ncbi:hypothetical protein [Chryseobacterium sp. GVT01B]|uniref:hypothetical protein n=1 Tax=Chryseobacterium sp. GVT01B TaxID=2862675 RepID=UPI001CC0C121|nr:hypothetical protein [Chryseobacterium sp. GVT01B]
MIQIILMLLGLAFSDNNANTPATVNGNNITTMTMQSEGIFMGESGIDGDTSGDNGQLPPKK